MPFIEINAAQLYYEVFGKDVAGQAPILLIHGSTITGQEDWKLVAPILAQRWRVIVPDCRGHGKSANPNHSYSFKELAADMAALVRALGYPRAHIIGHSNGGNVALVTLMEHPDITQTAVVQAANAYVSADLVEREPALFDPDRVARESPGWMNQMIALHGQTHGQEYWRELLQLTVKEIISEPNYTPGDLKRTERPTLVVQGEKDRVNAPSRHAQFIAQHVPYAELWIPEGVGHTVHDDMLLAWIEHVTDFLERRGNDDSEALYRLGRQRFYDARETVFDVRAKPAPEQPGNVRLSGKVLTPDLRQAALDCVQSKYAKTGAASLRVSAEQVRVLVDENTPWAMVNRGVADVRREPSSKAERMSQGLLGEAVRIIDEQDDWSWVRMERDGYLGWMPTAALYRCSRDEADAYRMACHVQVATDLLFANQAPDVDGEPLIYDRAGKLPFGVRLPVESRENALALVRLPDGRRWWVEDASLLLLDRGPVPNAEGIAFTLELIQRLVGVPYLWGGRTPFGIDCSGLALAFWGFMGVTLPRDADQQFRNRTPVDGTPRPGDLLFFCGDAALESNQRHASIVHVAISLGGEDVIHSTSALGGVVYNSLDPDSPIYRPWLRERLVGVRRFA